MLRPVQWSKNAVVLAGVVFSGEADEPAQLVRALLAVIAFCAASSTVYIVNDWHDRESDRIHPVKKVRPIAAGAVGVEGVILSTIALSMVTVAISVTLSWAFTGSILAYLGLMAGYTFWFRNHAFLDVFAIALGFLLRALAGALAVHVPMSPWLFLCTLLLALFLGFGKRRNELLVLRAAAAEHRRALREYTRKQLDWAVSLTAMASVAVYVVYTIVTNTARTDNALLLTAPFVALAIGRYAFLVFHLGLGGAPEVILVKDRLLQVSIIAWGATTLLVLNLL